MSPRRRTAAPRPAPAKRPAPTARRAWPAWAAPVACVLLAALVRAWAWTRQPFITVDGTEYVAYAEALLRGEAFHSIFPPGYPVLVALARVFVHDRVASAALISFVCGALLPWPAWVLARRAVGARWAWLPAVLVAVHPELARFSTLAMSESAYLLALYGALALAGSAAVAAALPAGLALGAAFAIRPEALGPAALLALRGGWRAVRGQDPRRTWALLGLGFLVLAVPCWFVFHATFGHWTLTPKLSAFRAPTLDWRLDEPRLDSTSDSTAASASPLAVVSHAPRNALGHARTLLQLWPAPLLLLSLAGLARRRGLEAIPLVQLAVLPFLGLSAQPRFVLSALPALALLSAVPIAAARGRAWRWGSAALLAIGVGWAGVNLAKSLRTPFDGWIDAHVHAGQWLAGVAEPGAPVMDRKPWVAFYAQRPYRVTPDEPYDRLVDSAVQSGVRYLVVDQGEAGVFRRQLEPLLYDDAFRDAEPRLELIYVGGRVMGYGIGLFRVLRPGESKRRQPPVVEASWLDGTGGARP